MDQSEKCPHGVYRAGHETAEYCGLCNPIRNDRTLSANPNFRPGRGCYKPEPVLHVDEFLQQPMGARLAQGKEYAQTSD